MVRPGPEAVALSLEVVSETTGAKVPVHLAGYEADPSERERINANQRAAAVRGKNRGLVIYRRQGTGRDGQAVWMMHIPVADRYLFRTQYVPEVALDPASIALPEPPPPSDLRLMTELQKHEAQRPHAEALAKRALAAVDPQPVLLAVGRDPIGQRFFDPFALRGAATIAAFALTFGIILTVAVWMIRNRPPLPR